MHVVMFVCSLMVFLAVYFVPAMVARARGHFNTTAIFVANLLLGWTVLGWAIAMIWAFTNTPASATPVAAASQKSGIAGFLKVLLGIFVVLIVLVTLVTIFGGHAAGGHGSSAATQSAPAGVPAPADEILGK